MVSLLVMLHKLRREIKEGKTFLQFSFLKSVGNGLAMILPLVVARLFSEELFASYCLAKMVVFFFAVLIMSSLRAPFVVFASQERTQTSKINKTFSVQCFLLLVSLALGCVSAILFARQIAAFAKIPIKDVPFILLGFIGMILKMFICNLFMGLDKRILNAISELVFGISCIVMVLLFYFTGTINMRNVFIVYPISSIVLIIMFIKTTDFSLLLPWRIDKQHLKGVVDFAKWQLLGFAAAYFINWGANLVMRYYDMMGDIGVFNLGFSFFKGLLIFMAVTSSYFLPFISSNINEPEKINNYLYRKRPRVVAVGVLGLAIFFFAAPTFLEALYPDKYIGSGLTIRVLLVAAALALYGIFYQPLFNALKMYRYLQTISISHVVLTTVLNLVLIPNYGYKGAAAATVFGYVLKVSAMEVCFRLVARKKLGT